MKIGTISRLRNRLLGRGGAALLLIVSLGLSGRSAAHAASGDCTTSGGTVTCTFTYTGGVQTWAVPQGITQVTLDVFGAQGGQPYVAAGKGGEAHATFAPVAGTQVRAAPGSPAAYAVFADDSNGKVWRSTDGGQGWEESDSGLPGGSDLFAVAGLTVYAAHEGVYVSSDGGKTWRDDNGVNGPKGAGLVGLAVDPGDGRSVYAVGDNHTFYRSADGGGHWSRSSVPLSGFENSTANALAVDPLRPATMLLASDTGMAVSTDSGATWQSASGIPHSTDVYVAAFSGANPDMAYVATSKGVYRTVDGGASWQQRQHGPALEFLAVDPAHPATVVGLDVPGGIYRTTDGGANWSKVGDTGIRPNAITFDPSHPGTVLVGTDRCGLYLSTDDGATWPDDPTCPFGEGLSNNDIEALSVSSLAAAVRAPLPTDTVAAPAPGTPGVAYAAATRHTIAGPFLGFYNAYGGLRLFGLPLTEAFAEQGATVQFFERGEMVLGGGHIHPAALGAQLTSGRAFAPVAGVSNAATRLYFPATGHILAGKFLHFWQTHNGSLVFGPPISEPVREQNGDGTGRVYLVQWCANGRLESHPELSGTSYEISVGQVGRQVLQGRGWL